MVPFSDLPNEIFLKILGYVTQSLTFAEAVYLRRIDARFRDCLIQFYVHGGRLLDTRLPKANAVSDRKVRPFYKNKYQFSSKLAGDLVERWWNNDTFVYPQFAKAVELVERRIFELIPGVEPTVVHRRFCDLFARQSRIADADSAIQPSSTPGDLTLRRLFRIFTVDQTKQFTAGRPFCKTSQTLDREQIKKYLEYGYVKSGGTRYEDEFIDNDGDSSDATIWALKASSFETMVRMTAVALGLAEAESLLPDCREETGASDQNDIIAAEAADGALQRHRLNAYSMTDGHDLDKIQTTAFVMAAIMGNVSFILYMLNVKPCPIMREDLRMAIGEAAREGHATVMKILIQDPHVRTELEDLLCIGQAGLLQACTSHSLPCVQLLVSEINARQLKASLDLRGFQGSFEWAIPRLRARPQLVERACIYLLTEKLALACVAGTSCEIVEYFVQKGARMAHFALFDNEKARSSLSFVAHAASSGFTRVISTLIRLGADPTQPPDVCQNYLSSAIGHNDVKMLAMLDGLGWDVCEKPRGLTLMEAVEQDAVSIVIWLLDKFAERAWGGRGDLLLHVAQREGRTGILRVLLERGHQQISRQGKIRVLEEAVERKAIDDVILLLQHEVRFGDSKSLADAEKLLKEEGQEQALPLIRLDDSDVTPELDRRPIS